MLRRTLVALAKKKAKNQTVVKMQSTAGTGFFYTTTKPAKAEYTLMLRKHDPVVNRHVLFKETKMPSGRVHNRKKLDKLKGKRAVKK